MSRHTDSVEEFEHAGCKVRIEYDTNPESPREWSNVGVIVYLGRQGYGDRQATPEEYTALEHGGWNGLVRHLQRQYGATVALPVSVLEHSGVHMWEGRGPHWSDSAGWDSGWAGFVYDDERQREECGTPLEMVKECLRGEIKTYDQFLTGDVYGYIVEAPNGEEDSCWGFFDLDYAIQEAKGAAENLSASMEHEAGLYLALLERISA